MRGKVPGLENPALDETRISGAAPMANQRKKIPWRLVYPSNMMINVGTPEEPVWAKVPPHQKKLFEPVEEPPCPESPPQPPTS